MRYLGALVVLLSLLLSTQALAITPVGANGQLYVDQTTGKLTNQHNYPIQLRGISSHGLQWYRDMVNPTALSALQQDWGADVVRLSTYIQEGGYENNPSFYKALVDSLIDEVTAAGMYVIIDFHQLYPGDPWYNVGHAVDFFTHMASTHADNNNIFYEIANEPNSYDAGGSTYLGYDVDWPTIKSYADSIVPIIRRYDDHNIILVGTPTWDQEPQSVIGKEINDPNVMYTVHFYAATHGSWTRNNVQTAIDNNIPLFVTECGTQDASGDGPNDFTSSSTWFNFLDQNGISWINWNFSPDPRSGAVFNKTPSNYSDYNFYTSASNLKEAGTWIKARMQTTDDWGTVAVLTENRTTQYSGQVFHDATVIDTTFESDKDTLVRTVVTRFTSDSTVVKIDSLSDGTIFKTLYDTTVTQVSSNIISDNTVTFTYVPTNGMTSQKIVHETTKDTVTSIDSTYIGLDTAVHIISDLFVTDSIVWQYDSTYDEISFQTWFDTSVIKDTTTLVDRIDTLWHFVDTTYTYDTTGTVGRDTVIYEDTLWGKGKKPDTYRLVTEENVNDSLIIIAKMYIDGSLSSSDTTVSIVQETRLLSVASMTVNEITNITDTISWIDTLHNQSLDTLTEETSRYTNWQNDTIVSGNIWQVVSDSLTVLDHDVSPTDTTDIFVIDSNLVRQYNDTLPESGVVADTTTSTDTLQTITVFDTVMTSDSIVLQNSDTLVTTISRENRVDSIFIQVDTLIDGSFSGKSSYDTIIVIDNNLLSQTEETLKFDVGVGILRPEILYLAQDEVIVTNNPWIPGVSQELPQMIFQLEGSGSIDIDFKVFDQLGNMLYSRSHSGWVESNVPMIYTIPVDQFLWNGGTAVAIIKVRKANGKVYNARRIIGVQK